MKQDYAQLLTTNELAERLRVSSETIQTWTREGNIPALRLSRKVIRYDWDAVLAALADPRAKGVASDS